MRPAACGLLLAACLAGQATAVTPEQAMANLLKVRSFRYTLELKRTEPPVIDGSFSGSMILPDTVDREGGWAGQPRQQVKARGGLEYFRSLAGEDTAWDVAQHSTDAELLTQVRAVLVRDSFRLVRQDARVIEYSFSPHMPFLDPLLKRKTTARFRIRRDRGLPEEISVTSSDGVVTWRTRFFDYDSVPGITFPFVRQWEVVLVRAAGSADSVLGDTLVLRRRLAGLGLDAQFAGAADTLRVYLERPMRDDALQALVRPGRAEVWVGRPSRLGDTVPEGGMRLAQRSDSLQKMIVERRVLTQDEIVAVETDDSASTLTLRVNKAGAEQLARQKRLDNSGMLWTLVIDRAIESATRIAEFRKGDRLEFRDVEPRSGLLLRSLLENEPLGQSWQVAGQRRLRP